MHLDETAAERQAEAGALVAPRVGAVQLLELPKQLGQVLGLDPDTGVADRDQQLLRAVPDGQGDGPGRRCELDGVGEEVVEHLLELAVVGLDRLRRLHSLAEQLETLLAGHRLEDGCHLLQRVGHVDRLQVKLHPPRLDLGQVQDVVDQA